jgi:hypothetical protein
MATPRRKPAFWRRTHPLASFDIAKLRSKTLPRGKRFESQSDASEESLRSQAILERDHRGKAYGVYTPAPNLIRGHWSIAFYHLGRQSAAGSE